MQRNGAFPNAAGRVCACISEVNESALFRARFR